MADTNPFDYIKSIQKTKVDMIRGSDNPELAKKGYVPFITNKALSFHMDSILLANEMNTHHFLDSDQQYAYLINTVRSMNRKHIWLKKVKDEDTASIAEYFNCNTKRALEIGEHLDKDSMKEIKKALTGGGTVKK